MCIRVRVPTLVASVLYQPSGDDDDVLQHGLRQVLQGHFLLDLQLVVHTNGIQDEDGGHRFAVAGQQAAELSLQTLLSLFKSGFLHSGDRTQNRDV